MPSITFWNRLEPRPRSTDLANALAARVRDPAWFLARQWQLGEFHGEDAASPAYARISSVFGPIGGWAAAGATDGASIGGGAPLERPLTAEAASPLDLSLAVELGQSFARFLTAANASDTYDAFLAAYPIGAAPALEPPRTARLRALWQGRVIDGGALWAASQHPPIVGQPPPGVPATVPAARWTDASSAVTQLAAWVTSTVGTIGDADPTTWRPDRLDYTATLIATAPAASGDPIALTTTPHRDGDVAWYALEVSPTPPPGFFGGGRAHTVTGAAIPAPVRFRGMPNERFWDFEDGRVDFGGLRPDRRNLASMLLMDFMLVHGNDWFLVPFPMQVGNLAATTLTVVDVFGDSTAIPRADAADPRWSMFSITNPDGTPAPYFALLQSGASAILDSAPVEDVLFLRDDLANLAWGVEHATDNHLGDAWTAADRVLAIAEPPPISMSPLAYRLQTSVPSNWIPFQPVNTNPGGASPHIALERAALLALDGPPALHPPLGRVLEPSSLPAGTPYRVRDEEIPREGKRVIRRFRRARGFDGSTHLWVARASSIGTGEGWSGLRFDLAAPTVPPDGT